MIPMQDEESIKGAEHTPEYAKSDEHIDPNTHMVRCGGGLSTHARGETIEGCALFISVAGDVDGFLLDAESLLGVAIETESAIPPGDDVDKLFAGRTVRDVGGVLD
jgi:hypothetical protein